MKTTNLTITSFPLEVTYFEGSTSNMYTGLRVTHTEYLDNDKFSDTWKDFLSEVGKLHYKDLPMITLGRVDNEVGEIKVDITILDTKSYNTLLTEHRAMKDKLKQYSELLAPIHTDISVEHTGKPTYE